MALIRCNNAGKSVNVVKFDTFWQTNNDCISFKASNAPKTIEATDINNGTFHIELYDANSMLHSVTVTANTPCDIEALLESYPATVSIQLKASGGATNHKGTFELTY